MLNPLSWIEALGDLQACSMPCVMVTVTEVTGSAPREPGARMLVAGGDLHWGTIGGGNLERLAISEALELLDRGAALSRSNAYPLAEKAGQCCGGRVVLFFEAFPWRRPTVAIFGAGHVGQALAKLAPWLAANVLLVDGREQHELRPKLGGELPFRLVCIDNPEAEIDTLPAGSLVVVMTHDHRLDQLILEHALAHGDLAFIGMIGSDRKWKRFRSRLIQKGFQEDQIARVKCPIGVSMASKAPEAIALSAATQLMECLSAGRRS